VVGIEIRVKVGWFRVRISARVKDPLVHQPFNTKHVTTILGQTRSVTLFMYIKSDQLVFQSCNLGIYKPICIYGNTSRTQGVQKARQVKNPNQENTMPRNDYLRQHIYGVWYQTGEYIYIYIYTLIGCRLLLSFRNNKNYTYFKITARLLFVRKSLSLFTLFVNQCQTWRWLMWTAETCSSKVK
jgi:hypothetical protein